MSIEWQPFGPGGIYTSPVVFDEKQPHGVQYHI